MQQGAYDLLHECLEEYDIVKTYLYSDYYSLLPSVTMEESDAWTAWEFYDKTRESGIVQVFRRNGSTEDSKLVKLRGLDAQASYEIYDFDAKTAVVKTGEELLNGMIFRLPREGSALLSIKKV